MSAESLFNKPFDEGTLTKLEIFSDYFKGWLPVFIASKKKYYKTVQVFDFFGGAGKDCCGQPGSALIILEVVQSFKKFIDISDINLILHFNELNPARFSLLNESLSSFDKEIEVRIYNKEFKLIFDQLYDSMRDSANFIFLDQNGIKEITSTIFKQITSLRRTDFLFFISSSYFKRFANTPEFKKYFPFNPDEISQTHYFHIHRKVLEYYKKLIANNKPYYLAPFSIKKGANIYGLIFGTNHTLGIEKFLSIAWKKDNLRGEANYDIDSEGIDLSAPSLFSDLNKPSKRYIFEEQLAAAILREDVTTNQEAYYFGLNEGFLLKDVNLVLKELKLEKRIDYDFTLITAKLHKLKPAKITLL